MSIVILHQDEALTLLSTRCVVPPEELGTFKTLLEQAQSLSAVLADEQTRMQRVESIAFEKGRQNGFRAGRQEGLDAMTEELSREKRVLAASHEQVLQQSVQMAFDIVHKIADTLDPVELLCALAVTAARSCSQDESLILRVHERYRQAVADKLQCSQSQAAGLFKRVIGDSSVELSACIIETPAARVIADLKTQVERLELQLLND